MWLATTAWCRDAPAEPARARADDEVRRANALAAERRYEEAIAAIEGAYGLDPRPELLFAWAQLERLSGDCGSAIVLYDRFLATNPRPEQKEATLLSRERCQRALANAPAPPAPVPAPPPPPTLLSPKPRSSGPSVWSQRLLLGGAAALAVAGTVAFFLAERDLDDARSPATYDGYLDDVEDARRKRVVGALCAGGALSLAIVWTARAFASGNGDVETGATVTLGQDGLTAMWRGRF